MDWFNYLKENGYFDPDKNPGPLAVDNGYSIPYWESLDFLQKLAAGFTDGQNLHLINEVISIIRSVSQSPKDNYHTWYVFLKILGTIPNENIPVDLFQYVPVWLSSRFNSSLQTTELCEKILPKFLNNQPSNADIEKAETILKHLFTIYRVDGYDPLNKPGSSYNSPVYLHFLKEAMTSKELKTNIIHHCHENTFYYLLDQVNLILRDNAVVAEWVYKESKLIVEFVADGRDKVLFVRKETDGIKNVIYQQRIENAVGQQAVSLLKHLQKVLKGLNITLTQSNEAYNRLKFGLSNDVFSIFGYNNFKDLDDEIVHSDTILPVFALVLRDFFQEMAIQKPKEIKVLLKDLFSKPEYNLPFFGRLAFYTIAANWNKLKPIFWGVIKKNDANHYFSRYTYRPELYYLLNNIQLYLSEKEAKILLNIINIGPQSEKQEEKSPDLWRHRWLDSLSKNAMFGTAHQELTDKFNLREGEYKNENKIQVFQGTVSPYTEEEILSMTSEELLTNLLNFNNGDWAFREPTVEGFAETLGKAIEGSPAHFDSFILTCIEVPYMYVYYMLNGYTAAWKAKKMYSWDNLLNFCLTYIDQTAFVNGLPVLQNDLSRATKEWVIGAIGRLISEGLRNDEMAFDAALLPLTKDILLLLAKSFKAKAVVERESLFDFPMHLVNSAEGQLLRAVLDYSLRKARLEKNAQWSVETSSLENEIKETLQTALDNEIIEAYTLLGMYLEQFYFLDAKWTSSKIKSWYKLKDPLWVAFMGGIAFGKPAFSKDVYALLYPHFYNALQSNKALFTNYHQGIVRHLTAFYLWDYENLTDEQSLNHFLIHHSPVSVLKEQARFLWAQQSHINKAATADVENFQRKALNIWRLIVDRFPQPETKDEHELIASLINLMGYITILDDENINLIKHSAAYFESYLHQHSLLEELIRFTAIPAQSNHIAAILKVVPFKHIVDIDKDLLIQLVIFLFENGQSETAKLICNKIQIAGADYLRDIYFRYAN